MLLAINCGNTNAVFGLYRERKLLMESKVPINDLQSALDCIDAVKLFLGRQRLPEDAVKGVVIGSVVPRLTGVMIDMARREFDIEPVVVDGRSPLGIKILYDDPDQVGSDRIAGALAAYTLYGGPCIVVDMGTATTFNVVSAEGEYLGGAICPGIESSMHSMSGRTARLYDIDIEPTRRVIARNTTDSLKSGIFHGSVAMIDGFIVKITEELRQNFKVVATGGFAEMIASHSNLIKIVNTTLVLDGLAIAYENISGNAY